MIETIVDYPDVCGYTLEKARKLLKEKGIHIKEVNILKPPREVYDGYDDNWRVVSLKSLDRFNVEIMICKPL